MLQFGTKYYSIMNVIFKSCLGKFLQYTNIVRKKLQHREVVTNGGSQIHFNTA